MNLAAAEIDGLWVVFEEKSEDHWPTFDEALAVFRTLEEAEACMERMSDR